MVTSLPATVLTTLPATGLREAVAENRVMAAQEEIRVGIALT
jgi:hypothetical protein